MAGLEALENLIWARRGLFARFTAEVEREFAHFYAKELLRRVRPAAIAAAVVMLAYSVMDLFMIPKELVSQFLWIRTIFITLPMFAIWWISKQAWAEKYIQILCGLAAASASLAVTALVCLSRLNGTPIEYEGIILLLLFFYCCGGLSVRTAAFGGLLVLIVYPVADHLSGLSGEVATTRAIFIASANFVGLLSATLAELSARRNFALAYQLNRSASRDDLTGLLNRRALRDRLNNLWRHARSVQTTLHIAMVDVDHFKRFNDRYGHSEGDEVLRRIAAVLRAHCKRPHDSVARFGGEEFVCVWTGNDSASMQNLLAKIQRAVKSLDVKHDDAEIGYVSISMGVQCVHPDRPQEIKDALHAADTLLYQAKSDGRGRAIYAFDGKAETILAPVHP